MTYISITERWTDNTLSSERLKGGEGSVALTGFVDAKRADETGRAEDSPQSLAVSPGLAKLRIVFDYLHDVLRSERKHYGNPLFAWWPPHRRDARVVLETIARVEKELRWIEWAAAKPDSEQRTQPPVVPQPSPAGY